MPWFFCQDPIDSGKYTITGEDAAHIGKSLRMKVGEELTLCSAYLTEYSCKILSVSRDSVEVEVLSQKPCENEPNIKVVLFQAVTKGDKMDMIIQKAVEIGASELVPVITSRCVSRPDKASAEKKTARYQKICENAARQSRRGIVPKVTRFMSFEEAVEYSASLDSRILFYEGGGKRLSELIGGNIKSLGVFVGSEGGFSPEEVYSFEAKAGSLATLGKRILRAETAPLAALSVIMYLTGNFE